MNNQNGFGVVGALLIVVVLGLLGGAGWYIYNSQESEDTETSEVAQDEAETQQEPTEETQENFTEVRADNLVITEPQNNENWSAGSANQVIMGFNKSVDESKSSISVTKNGVDVTDGGLEVGKYYLAVQDQVQNSTMMFAVSLTDSSKGNYEVSYNVCFVDGSCSEGFFGYSAGF